MENSEEPRQTNSVNNVKFTAVRLDLRHLKSSGRHGPRSQVLVISDQTSGLEVKRMVAEKNGLDDHLVSQLDLIATVSSGDSKSECLMSDDRCLLDVHRVSPEDAVSFSLRWKNEPKLSKTNYVSPSCLHNFNASKVQDLYSELISGKYERKSNDRFSFTNGSNIPGYRKTEDDRTTGEPRTMDDPIGGQQDPIGGQHDPITRLLDPMKRLQDPIGRLHGGLSSNYSSWYSDRSKNECIIHYEPQSLSSKADVCSSNVQSAAVQELRSSTSSRPTSDDGTTKNPRASKAFEVGTVGSVGVGSPARNSNESQNSNSSFDRLPTIGSLTRGERNSLGDIEGIGTSSHTFCPVVPAGKTTSGDSDQGGDQREAKFSSLPNMDQMTVAQRCRAGAQASVRQAASSLSLPCISTAEGGLVGAGRRCLPQLCIPEEIVEEKKNLLSKRLEKRLQSAGQRKKHRKRTLTNHLDAPGASHISNGGLDVKESKRRASGGDSDDDCASVTSWEVAEILASADPMAPQDSDYEDSPPSSDDDNVTSVLKSRRVPSSPSDADTLDGSSAESDHRGGELAKDFSPIECHGRSEQNVQGRLDFRSRLSSENQVASAKPVAVVSSKTLSADLLTTLHNPNRILKNPSKTSSVKGLSLFKLVRNGSFLFRTAILVRSRSSAQGRVDRLPFEIFNDVIQLSDVKKGTAREKFTVPVIGDSSDIFDWRCLEGSFEAGDIVVEVNGDLVLNRSSSDVIATCFRSSFSDSVQFLLARQRRTQK